MAYFIVQVQSNHEVTIQKRLTELFSRKKVNFVKTIYALDSKTILDQPSSTSSKDIELYLHQQRLREHLNNMRFAFANMDKSIQPNLKQQYKNEIRRISKELRDYQSLNSKNKTLVTGYILIELDGDFERLPSDIYYDIKSIPKVIGIPSTYNVPIEEVQSFFETIKEEFFIAN